MTWTADVPFRCEYLLQTAFGPWQFRADFFLDVKVSDCVYDKAAPSSAEGVSSV